MRRTIVEVHVIQTVPPSNINRDDTGSPKTALYGGTRRARVSSQAWKRAVREAFHETVDRDDLGTRTKRLVELLGDRVAALEPSLAGRAQELATEVLGAAGIKLTKARKAGEPDESGYLLFLSHRQLDALAKAAIEVAGQPDIKAALKEIDVKKLADTEHSIDVALFGRMVADVTDLNVDAAAQVAHAISVHAVENEYDYFTAVDDHKQQDAEEDAGAGMIGTVEFNSSTLYRYANVDVDRLQDNLGSGDAATRAVSAFVQAFITSMPTGKQNTFANRTLPDAIVVTVRDSQPVNLVGAFETAITAEGGKSRVAEAVGSLVQYTQDVERSYSEVPVQRWTIGVGSLGAVLAPLAEAGDLSGALAGLAEVVRSRIDDDA